MVPSANPQPSTEIPKPPPAKPQDAQKKSSGFAKGFLLGSNKGAKKQKKEEPEIEDLSHIKAKPKEDSLKLAEIEAMKKQVLETQSSWLTPELLKKMGASEKIRKALNDPIFLQVSDL